MMDATTSFREQVTEERTCRKLDTARRGRWPLRVGRYMEVPLLVRPEAEALAELPVDMPFFDVDFPPTSASLLSTVAPVASWQRVDAALPNAPLFSASDASPHKLLSAAPPAHAWLANALALLQTRPDLVRRLFASTAHASRGMLTLRLFKHGGWRPVLIDTMVPCDEHGTPAFPSAAPLEDGAAAPCWPTLLLKGFAKLHGAYSALDGGDAAEALVDFTGGATTRRQMPETADDAAANEVWTEMLRSHRRGMMQAVVPADPHGGAPFRALIKQTLLPQYFYPVLALKEEQRGVRLVCLLNPWMSGEWRGAWSADSAEWANSPDVAAQLWLPASSGKFWVQLSDLIKYFDTRYTVMTGGELQSMAIEGEWAELSCGGPPSSPSWCCNPQYWISCSKSAAVTIELSQRDRRLASDDVANPEARSAAYPPIAFAVVKGGTLSSMGSGRVWARHERAVVAETAAARRRDVTLTVELSAHKMYCIVPCTLNGVLMPFVLRVQAECEFTVKQAQPSVVARHVGEITSLSSGGPPSSATWCINPQYWLTLRPPPSETAMAQLRVTVSAAAAGAGEPPPLLGFTLLKGAMHREKLPARPRSRASSPARPASALRAPPPPAEAAEGRRAQTAEGGARRRPAAPQAEARRPHACASAGGLSSSRVAIAMRPGDADENHVMNETRPLPDGATLHDADVGEFNLGVGLPVRDTSNLQPTRKQIFDQGDVVGEAAPSANPSLLTSVDPGCPYVICIHAPRALQLARFTLEVSSESLLEVALIEPSRQRTLNGAWRADSSGGSHIERGDWAASPKYSLSITKDTTVEITLQRPAAKWDKIIKVKTLEAMLGLYVIVPEDRPRPIVWKNVVYQSAFIPANEISCSLHLKPLPNGFPYVIMPATFGPGMKGPFTLGVIADAPIDLQAFDKDSLPRGRSF
ncbi:hypothetical protein AB1Y20_010974 [Prymnesium parvum]|uniref:Calpain catalytic domain-containing protein n=1 Tax=Prymnesium parvum TaxID=97485 RepID=A0AB34IMP4_PRYPA